jgi:hypothetical protein
MESSKAFGVLMRKGQKFSATYEKKEERSSCNTSYEKKEEKSCEALTLSMRERE